MFDAPKKFWLGGVKYKEKTNLIKDSFTADLCLSGLAAEGKVGYHSKTSAALNAYPWAAKDSRIS